MRKPRPSRPPSPHRANRLCEGRRAVQRIHDAQREPNAVNRRCRRYFWSGARSAVCSASQRLPVCYACPPRPPDRRDTSAVTTLSKTWSERMIEGQPQSTWMDQRASAEGIKAVHGLEAAIDRAVCCSPVQPTKAAGRHPDLGRDLMRLLPIARSTSTAEAIEPPLARVGRPRRGAVLTDVRVDEPCPAPCSCSNIPFGSPTDATRIHNA